MPAAEAALPARPAAFLRHYVRRRPLLFGTLALLIVAGAACSVGVQYGMKLIVDAMALDDRHSLAIWRWLALFIVLIAAESLCWRLGGWLGCHAVVATGVDVRLEKVRAAHDLCLWLMAGGMLAWVVQAWRAGEALPGDVVVVSALTFRILHGSRDLALSLVDASQQFGVIADMLQAVAVPHGVADCPGAAPLRAGPGEIRIEALDFAYPGQPPVFRGLHLHIPAGQRVGIVGPSGAGKSTLLRLLARTADPDAGCILVDGQPIAQLLLASLRAAIGVVPQDIHLLHRTVMENLRYGRPQATDAEVVQAARDAHCDGFVRALAQGDATVVGERGTRLSGGQRQRIGIARAMLKNAPILLLDEATSALDSRSEGQIQRALDRLMRGRTVLAVAHRLSTVADFDRILVMAEGRIVEDGAPQQLRRAGGLYAQLWALQAEGQETE